MPNQPHAELPRSAGRPPTRARIAVVPVHAHGDARAADAGPAPAKNPRERPARDVLRPARVAVADGVEQRSDEERAHRLRAGHDVHVPQVHARAASNREVRERADGVHARVLDRGVDISEPTRARGEHAREVIQRVFALGGGDELEQSEHLRARDRLRRRRRVVHEARDDDAEVFRGDARYRAIELLRRDGERVAVREASQRVQDAVLKQRGIRAALARHGVERSDADAARGREGVIRGRPETRAKLSSSADAAALAAVTRARLNRSISAVPRLFFFVPVE
eukprot:31269-Pelagococcus_subviridis.AAC.2